jgi:hypothetical protein
MSGSLEARASAGDWLDKAHTVARPAFNRPLTLPAPLTVWSRHLLERADLESLGVSSPGVADELVWGEASECFEPSGEVIDVDEAAQARSQLTVGFIEVIV